MTGAETWSRRKVPARLKGWSPSSEDGGEALKVVADIEGDVQDDGEVVGCRSSVQPAASSSKTSCDPGYPSVTRLESDEVSWRHITDVIAPRSGQDKRSEGTGAHVAFVLRPENEVGLHGPLSFGSVAMSPAPRGVEGSRRPTRTIWL